MVLVVCRSKGEYKKFTRFRAVIHAVRRRDLKRSRKSFGRLDQERATKTLSE